MSIRNRTTKLVARRHDLNYFKRMSPVRLWQWYLALGALGVAVLWFAGSQLVRGDAAFSSGPISSAHDAFGNQCEVCHVPMVKATRFTPSIGRRNHVPDSACLSCHAGAITPHHAAQAVGTQRCASCHLEHIGSTHLANTADKTCTGCHLNLHTQSGMLNVAASVGSFAHEHPDFRALRTATAQQRDAAFALRFTHAEHMQPGLSSPTGKENLSCQSCHQNAVTPIGQPVATPGKAGFGFVAVSFEKGCQRCHGLEFDTHIHAEAPHAQPAVVRAFVTQAINGFAQQHPDVVAAEIRNWPAEPMLPGQRPLPPPHNTAEWIGHRIAYAETILYREKCELCHRDLNRPQDPMPSGQPVQQHARLLPPARPAVTETAGESQWTARAASWTVAAPGASDALFRSAATNALLATSVIRAAQHAALRPVLFTTLASTREQPRMVAQDSIPRRPDAGAAQSTVAAAPMTAGSLVLPQIEPAHQPEQWYTGAVFSHPAHNGVSCAECHAQALTSNSGKDLLMPGIATCRRCHDGMSSPQGPPVKSNHAESGCFLCHVYHGPATGDLQGTHSIQALAGR